MSPCAARIRPTNLARAATPAEPQFRSIGDYLKKVAAGDEAAAEFHRATSGQTSTDTIKNETYLGEFIKWVEDRRQLINTTDGTADEGEFETG